MNDKLYTPRQLSALLQVPVGVLAQWRCRGQGPRWLKLGGKHVRYAESDIREYLDDAVRESTRRRPTRDPAGRSRSASNPAMPSIPPIPPNRSRGPAPQPYRVQIPRDTGGRR